MYCDLTSRSLVSRLYSLSLLVDSSWNKWPDQRNVWLLQYSPFLMTRSLDSWDDRLAGGRMLAYAGVCWRMLTYADVCSGDLSAQGSYRWSVCFRLSNLATTVHAGSNWFGSRREISLLHIFYNLPRPRCVIDVIEPLQAPTRSHLFSVLINTSSRHPRSSSQRIEIRLISFDSFTRLLDNLWVL
jgi:hypothetical protein